MNVAWFADDECWKELLVMKFQAESVDSPKGETVFVFSSENCCQAVNELENSESEGWSDVVD